MGVVQFMNYLRTFQFIAHVSELNKHLQHLDGKVLKLKAKSEQHDEKINLDYLSTSTVLYESIEIYREAFSKIWRLHESLNRCFGLSILVITLNALMSSAFNLYLSILTHSKNITVGFISGPALHSFHITILFFFLVHTCQNSDALVCTYAYMKLLIALIETNIKYLV